MGQNIEGKVQVTKTISVSGGDDSEFASIEKEVPRIILDAGEREPLRISAAAHK